MWVQTGKIAAVGLALGLLSACDFPATGGGNAPPLGDYQLLTMGGEDVESFHVTMLLQDGQVAGGGFCNRYTATQAGTLPALAIGPIVATRRACFGDRMERDTAYLAALEAATTARFADGRLTISGSGPELVYEPHVPDARD